MIGVLALQGDFLKHQSKISELGAQTCLVVNSSDLASLSGLIIPGGESSVLLKLSEGNLQEALASRIRAGLPTFATCAGLILLAKGVLNPEQPSLGMLDVDVKRNAYGRQVESFITPDLVSHSPEIQGAGGHIEGVFIRAPKIIRLGAEVQTLISYNSEAVMVKQGNVIGATFHPELSLDSSIHRYFLNTCQQ